MDIVERLRDRGLMLQQPERDKIADEIERLRAKVAALEGDVAQLEMSANRP